MTKNVMQKYNNSYYNAHLRLTRCLEPEPILYQLRLNLIEKINFGDKVTVTILDHKTILGLYLVQKVNCCHQISHRR